MQTDDRFEELRALDQIIKHSRAGSNELQVLNRRLSSFATDLQARSDATAQAAHDATALLARELSSSRDAMASQMVELQASLSASMDQGFSLVSDGVDRLRREVLSALEDVDHELQMIRSDLQGISGKLEWTDEQKRFLALKRNALELAKHGDHPRALAQARAAVETADPRGVVDDRIARDPITNWLICKLKLTELASSAADGTAQDRQEQYQQIWRHALNAYERGRIDGTPQSHQAAADSASVLATLCRTKQDFEAAHGWSLAAYALEQHDHLGALIRALASAVLAEDCRDLGALVGFGMLVEPRFGLRWLAEPALALAPERAAQTLGHASAYLVQELQAAEALAEARRPQPSALAAASSGTAQETAQNLRGEVSRLLDHSNRMRAEDQASVRSLAARIDEVTKAFAQLVKDRRSLQTERHAAMSRAMRREPDPQSIECVAGQAFMAVCGLAGASVGTYAFVMATGAGAGVTGALQCVALPFVAGVAAFVAPPGHQLLLWHRRRAARRATRAARDASERAVAHSEEALRVEAVWTRRRVEVQRLSQQALVEYEDPLAANVDALLLSRCVLRDHRGTAWSWTPGPQLELGTPLHLAPPCGLGKLILDLSRERRDRNVPPLIDAADELVRDGLAWVDALRSTPEPPEDAAAGAAPATAQRHSPLRLLSRARRLPLSRRHALAMGALALLVCAQLALVMVSVGSVAGVAVAVSSLPAPAAPAQRPSAPASAPRPQGTDPDARVLAGRAIRDAATVCGVHGSVSVDLVVAPDGRISAAAMGREPARSLPTRACVESRLRQARLTRDGMGDELRLREAVEVP